MARARSARGEGIYSIAGPQWQDLRALIDGHLPSTEVLRRLVPIFLIGFAAIATFGFVYQIGSAKEAALKPAERELDGSW